MSIETKHTKSGDRYRFRYKYKNSQGEKKNKAGSWRMTPEEAEKDQQEFVRNLEDMLLKEEIKSQKIDVLPFRKVHKEWASTARNSEVPKTIRERFTLIPKFFPQLMDLDIYEIRPVTIQALINRNDQYLSLSTTRKNRVIEHLNGVFKYAMRFYDLENNPMNSIERFKKTEEERLRKIDFLDPDEFSRFLSYIGSNHATYSNLYYFLYWTGARLNEACSLTFKDFSDTYVHVWRQYDHKEGKWRILKTKGSVRDIYLNKALCQIVEQQRNKYSKQTGFNENWFIFGGENHLPYTNIERIKNNALEKAGIRKVKIHSFRHSHASYLLKKGVPIYKVSRRLGHASITTTTDIYGHLIPKERDEISELLDKIDSE